MNSEWIDLIERAENYGLYSITIKEVSKFIAYEQFYDGKFSLNGFDSENEYSLDNKKFVKALNVHINKVENLIVACIERRDVKVTLMTRDFNTGLINTEKTLISVDEVSKVFELYEIPYGQEGFPFSDFLDKEIDLFANVIQYIARNKELSDKVDKSEFKEKVHELIDDEDKIESMIIENYNLSSENKMLKNLKATNSDKPLSLREKNTLLTIIAALASQIGLDISMTSKTGELISRYTQQLGAFVDGETIANKLKQIPDAIERRSK